MAVPLEVQAPRFGAPDTDGIWYDAYPPGVQREIDSSQYETITQYFDECTAAFRDRVAYVSIGASLTYGALARKAEAFAAWLQSVGIQPGERVKVFVVARDASLTADDILQHCRRNLTGYKMPRDVKFREALPQTNVGKILRRALRDEEVAKLKPRA